MVAMDQRESLRTMLAQHHPDVGDERLVRFKLAVAISHPHGQIDAFPFVPPAPAREAAVAAASACPVCRQIRDGTTAGRLDDRGRDGLAAALARLLGRYDRLFDRPFPYVLWLHPGVHLYVHVAPPLRSSDAVRVVAAGELGSGLLTNPVEPEAAAAARRDA
jgi:galactose-1-phosphate uridylyltransferase